MKKRHAPESGFDTTNPSKRPISVNASASHLDDPTDSIQPNPSPNPIASSTPSAAPAGPPTHTNGSATQHAPVATECRGQADDVFLSDLHSDGAANDEDTFILDDNQRSQLAEELSALQSMPASTIDDPVENPNQQYEESPGEESGVESIPEASSGKKNKENGGRSSRLKKKKTMKKRYEPVLWKNGAPDSEAAFLARKSDALICGTTNITLDTEPLLVNGTIWNDVLLDELPQLLRSGNSIPLPPGQDKYDFLKACFRMGNFIEPNRMSRLLGGGYRSPEYCNFLLKGFLGLLNNRKARRVLRGDTPEPPPEEHKDVVVYGDQLYPSDDEILVNQETGNADADGEPVPYDGNDGVIMIEDSDQEEGDGGGDPPHVLRDTVRKTKHTVTSEQRFFAKPSYVLRNYMSIVAGQQINDIDDFEAYCKKVGATFLADPKEKPLGHMKWLNERMPAPELGTERAVSEPLELWKNAMRTYSAKNLSRCALIKADLLLDSLLANLTFESTLHSAANEAEPTTRNEKYFRVKRPVTAIAPVPLLYLADRAVDFVLKVLSVAVQIDELNPRRKGKNFTIDRDVVVSSARYLDEDSQLGPQLYFFSADTLVLGREYTYRGWPAVLQRPLTACESLELCDRTPKASISIPSSIIEETNAVLTSFRNYVNAYRNYIEMLKRKDPINWFRIAGENNEHGEDGGDSNGGDNEADSASSPRANNQLSPGAESESDPLAPPDEMVDCRDLLSKTIARDLKSYEKYTNSTVCLHRLGWICLHALGIAVEKGPDNICSMGYASSANYTNFAQFRTKRPIVVTVGALISLAEMADALVREEAEVLTACAAHDDGRPWIDRADVALVTSVRKEEFHYADL